MNSYSNYDIVLLPCRGQILSNIGGGFQSGEYQNQYFDALRSSYVGRNNRFQAESCAEIKSTFSNAESGYYWLNGVRSYCRFDLQTGSDDDSLGWERIALVDMSDTTQRCPGNTFRLVQPPAGDARYCVKTTDGYGCDAVLFQPGSTTYSRVYGRVIGIQIGSADITGHPVEIDEPYLDGVSLTLNSQPRTHIWSFMSFTSEFHNQCPCSANSPNTPLPFIGNDYFCESGSNVIDVPGDKSFPDDPIWDGEDCRLMEVGCCNLGGSQRSPPWFYKELPQPVSGQAVELRICTDQPSDDESVGVLLIELYVQ